MKPPARSLVALLLLVIACVGRATPARADEIAPALEGADLRQLAQLELKQLVATMPDTERRRLAGVYAAFDSSVSDLVAQAACDDDGDYVVVVSDAMLRVLSILARADCADERTGSHRVEDYASFLARSQVPGRRVLPPAPTFFESDPVVPEPMVALLGDVLAFVIADELARLRAGDLVCPRPTVTRESGDEVWSSGEERAARSVAARIYPAHQHERDAEAVAHLRASGRTGRGALAVVRFFARLAGGRYTPSYLTSHPESGGRLAALSRTIDASAGLTDTKGVTSSP